LTIAVVVDGAGVTGSLAGEVAEEEAVQNLFFLGAPLDSLCSYLAGQNHSYTILFSSTIGRKQAELACINYDYHYMHVLMIMSY
jgi:hypothetical protein